MPIVFSPLAQQSPDAVPVGEVLEDVSGDRSAEPHIQVVDVGEGVGRACFAVSRLRPGDGEVLGVSCYVSELGPTLSNVCGQTLPLEEAELDVEIGLEDEVGFKAEVYAEVEVETEVEVREDASDT